MIKSTLWFGDNLDILRRYIADESVDLVYLDPPFNSNRTYNVLFKERSGEDSPAQMQAFADTWRWDRSAQGGLDELTMGSDTPAPVREMMSALRRFIGSTDIMAYLVMMAQRLLELHRVLKPTGSLYLHCDPTASHYLKVVLDAVFSAANFRSEIVWKRTSAHSSAKRYGPVHDTLLFYTKSDDFVWNPQYEPYSQTYLDEFYTHVDADGRRWRRSDLTGSGTRQGATGQPWRGIDVTAKGRHWAVPPADLDRLDAAGRIHWPTKSGGMPMLKRYADEQVGVPLQDVWTDIRPMHNLSTERLGYPTQKPLALLERVITASSNPGDLVLDPFCGCGTAVVAAEKLGRRWFGIDVTHLAISVMKYRLKSAFPGIDVPVGGEPRDIGSARQRALEDPYEFQWWANSLVMAVPKDGKRKKGADRGIDGVRYFVEDHSGRLKRCIVQVKSGKVSSRDIRELRGTVERQAELGLFITLEKPTEPMLQEAAEAGFYRSPVWGEFPRIQIATVEDLLLGREPKLPPVRMTLGQADRIVKPDRAQVPLPRAGQPEIDEVVVPPVFRDALEGMLEGGD